jgi:hypothetical protein
VFRVAAVVLWVCVVAALFLFLHTGARTGSTCLPTGAGMPDGISLWPPGTVCSGGEPEVQQVRVHPAFPFGAAAAGLVLFGAVRLTLRLRPGASV